MTENKKLSISVSIEGIEEVQEQLKEMIAAFDRIKLLEERINQDGLSMKLCSNVTKALEDTEKDAPEEQQSLEFEDESKEYTKLVDISDTTGIHIKTLRHHVDDLNIPTFRVEPETCPNRKGYTAILTEDVPKLLAWKPKAEREKAQGVFDGYSIVEKIYKDFGFKNSTSLKWLCTKNGIPLEKIGEANGGTICIRNAYLRRLRDIANASANKVREEDTLYLDEQSDWVSFGKVVRLAKPKVSNPCNYKSRIEQHGVDVRLAKKSKRDGHPEYAIRVADIPKVLELLK